MYTWIFPTVPKFLPFAQYIMFSVCIDSSWLWSKKTVFLSFRKAEAMCSRESSSQKKPENTTTAQQTTEISSLTLSKPISKHTTSFIFVDIYGNPLFKTKKKINVFPPRTAPWKATISDAAITRGALHPGEGPGTVWAHRTTTTTWIYQEVRINGL